MSTTPTPWASNFNPRTPRGVRHTLRWRRSDKILISIHAPREGCDSTTHGSPPTGLDFNPRTPRGVRLLLGLSLTRPQNFNPRTPRGVRPNRLPLCSACRHFNPRTPRGVRRTRSPSRQTGTAISIHAPREGCDRARSVTKAGRVGFQSTHPARGATCFGGDGVTGAVIFQSTHPARGAT